MLKLRAFQRCRRRFIGDGKGFWKYLDDEAFEVGCLGVVRAPKRSTASVAALGIAA